MELDVLVLQAAQPLIAGGDGVEGLDHLGLELGLDCGDRKPILHFVVVVFEVDFADYPIGHRVLTVGAFGGRLEWGGGYRFLRWYLRRPFGLTRDRVGDDDLAVGPNHRRGQGFGARTCISCVEVKDIAQQDLALVELVPPDDDGLEGERAFAEPCNHGLAAGLDALGEGDLALARKQFHRAHFVEVHAHRVVGALGGFPGPGLSRNRPLLDFDKLVFALRLLLCLLAGRRLFPRLSLNGVDHVDAHLAERRQDVLHLLGLDLLRGQQRVDLAVGDIAAHLGAADQLPDGRLRKVEHRPVNQGLGPLLLRHLFLLRPHLDLACHESPKSTLSVVEEGFWPSIFIEGVDHGCSEIRSGGRARGRLFPAPLGSPEVSSAAGPRVATFCEQACGRGE